MAAIAACGGAQGERRTVAAVAVIVHHGWFIEIEHELHEWSWHEMVAQLDQ